DGQAMEPGASSPGVVQSLSFPPQAAATTARILVVALAIAVAVLGSVAQTVELGSLSCRLACSHLPSAPIRASATFVEPVRIARWHLIGSAYAVAAPSAIAARRRHAVRLLRSPMGSPPQHDRFESW